MKIRRHTNNDGRRQIQCGKTLEQVERMAKLLKLQAKAASRRRLPIIDDAPPKYMAPINGKYC